MFGLMPFRTDTDVIGGTLAGFMSDFFNDDFLTPMGMNFDMSKFNIKADMRETDNEYLISAKLPGVNKEDINLDYNNNNLTIRARFQNGELQIIAPKAYKTKTQNSGIYIE